MKLFPPIPFARVEPLQVSGRPHCHDEPSQDPSEWDADIIRSVEVHGRVDDVAETEAGPNNMVDIVPYDEVEVDVEDEPRHQEDPHHPG